MWTVLKRVDPKEHVNRWYAVGVQASLFHEVALVRFWGSREKNYQQSMVQAFDDEGTAQAAAERLVREKVRRGYQVVVEGGLEVVDD